MLLTSRSCSLILRGLAGLHLAGGVVVEVAPAYDHAEITSIEAVNVVDELLALMATERTDGAGPLSRGGPAVGWGPRRKPRD